MSAPFDLTQTDRLLATTRAVRRRLDLSRPVERQRILECIGLAQQAPTASNRQNWHWLVVTQPERRRALAEIYRSVARTALPRGLAAVAPDDRQTRRVYDSAAWLAEHLHEVPVQVIPCIEGRLETPSPAAAAVLYGSIYPAVWSFQLALRSRGLGSAFTSLHLLREAEAAELLGIPDSVTQVALLPVAYTRGGDFRRARRPPPETVTHFEGWGD